jgi:mRNA interferase HigB
MRIISKRALREFWDLHKEAEKPLLDWYEIVKKADWNSFSDVRETFRHADIYCDCVIFNIGGNKFRLIARHRYQISKVFVRFVLTHGEYDKGKWKDDCED